MKAWAVVGSLLFAAILSTSASGQTVTTHYAPSGYYSTRVDGTTITSNYYPSTAVAVRPPVTAYYVPAAPVVVP
ncbi:MAG: hypothetical protein N2C14_22540, partial [Planctomycetales bacterium]